MNVGIHFGARRIAVAARAHDPSGVREFNFELPAMFGFTDKVVYVGEDAIRRSQTDPNVRRCSLESVARLNGITSHGTHYNIERCIAALISHVLGNIGVHTKALGLASPDLRSAVLTIPLENYYFWSQSILAGCNKLGLVPGRITYDAAAHFSDPSVIARLERSCTQPGMPPAKHGWLRRLLLPARSQIGSERLVLAMELGSRSTSLTLLECSEGIVEVVGGARSISISETSIQEALLEVVNANLLEVGVDIQATENKSRIAQLADELFRVPRSESVITDTLHNIRCSSGEYRTITLTLDTKSLRSTMTPMLTRMGADLKALTAKTSRDVAQVAVIGTLSNHPYLHPDVSSIIEAAVGKTDITFISERDLAKGAQHFSEILSGANKDVLVLQALPFSVQLELQDGQCSTLVPEFTSIPTVKETALTIRTRAEAEHLHLNLLIKEGELWSSVEPWKFRRPRAAETNIRVSVGIDAAMRLEVRVTTQDGSDLDAERCSTYSLVGAPIGSGIRGQAPREYISNLFSHLSTLCRTRDVATFEPDETFYSFLRNREAFTALRYLGRAIRPDRLPDVIVEDAGRLERAGVGGYFRNGSIVLPDTYPADPLGTGYILAHELSHHLLLYEEGIYLENEQENEILTEIYVVFRGMGKLFLNGLRSSRGKGDPTHSHGYLTDDLVRYIHEIYFEKLGITAKEFEKNLTPDALKILAT